MGILISLITLAVGLAIDWFAANTMYEIAVMKGHSDKKYFWWCFWVAVFGYLMVIALPDGRGVQAQSAPSADELPEL